MSTVKNKDLCIKYELQLQEFISDICRNQYKYFLSKKNVVGVGCGHKVKAGFRTSDLCVQVFVIKKLPKYKLLSKDIVPLYFKGIKTDIIETGVFTACSLKKRVRPVPGGYSVSADIKKEYYGTAGCLVTNGINKFILGSNHALANENTLNIGDPIIQPAARYGGSNPKDTVATLYRFVPLRFNEAGQQRINFSDSAIGLLTNPNIASPEIAFVGKVQGVKIPILEEPVKKVGAKTGFTEGIVTTLSATTTVNYASGKTCFFQNLILTTAMAYKGDSGSVLLNKHNYALGLLLSRGDDFTAYSRIDTVLDQLDVKIVT